MPEHVGPEAPGAVYIAGLVEQPEVLDALATLGGAIDRDAMARMNGEVDRAGRAPAEVAREFLEARRATP